MTAGIFAKHGVWTGSCREGERINPKGFFENKLFKSRLKAVYSGNLLRATPIKLNPVWEDEVKRILEIENYEGGQWLVKHSAIYWRTWDQFKPKFINVRRDPEGVFQSCRNVGFYNSLYTDNQLAQIIQNHNDAMDGNGGPNVYTDEVVQGEYSSLEAAFDYCGLVFDKSIVDDFVEKRHWHY